MSCPRPSRRPVVPAAGFFVVAGIVGLLQIQGCGDDTSTTDTDAALDVVSGDIAADTLGLDVAADIAFHDDTTTTDDTFQPSGLSVTGTLYDDLRDIARSAWLHAPVPARAPLPGQTVTLLGPPPAAPRTTTTAADGRFVFDDVPPGRHLVVVEPEPSWRCNSNNLPRRVPAAIREGSLKIVTFGDSVPHWGPTPWFPARLKAWLDPFADVTDTNIAVPGSTSPEWLPDGRHFPTLARHLPDADLVVFSLGGNDLGAFLNEFTTLSPEELLADLATYLALFDAQIDRIETNLKTTISAIRASNPTADILWFVYPNYAWNDHWAPFLGEWADLVRTMLGDRLDDVRTRMSRVDHLLLADMYGGIEGEDVAALMIDELHLNAAGHERYALELFRLLGGVEVGANALSSIGLDRLYGFATTPPSR